MPGGWVVSGHNRPNQLRDLSRANPYERQTMNPDRPRRASSAGTARNDPRLLAMCCAALAAPVILILAVLENTPVVWLFAVVSAVTCATLFVLLKGRGSRPPTGRA